MHRHGSFYAPVNADCTEFCPHPSRQDILMTGHYELLSREQGKIGKIFLSTLAFTDTDFTQRLIPGDEYCTANNEPQEEYSNRVFDTNQITNPSFPVYGQHPSSTDHDDSQQKHVVSNVDLRFHSQATLPAVLDLRWNPHPVFPPAKHSTPGLHMMDSLFSASLEDGTVRLFSLQQTASSSPAVGLAQQCALPISSSALCLYTDWSNHARYTTASIPTPDSLTIAGDTSSASQWSNAQDYMDYWDAVDHDWFQGGHHLDACSQNKADDSPAVSDDSLAELYCYEPYHDSEAADDDDDYYDDSEIPFKQGKHANDVFLATSLSDGSVAIADVVPRYEDENHRYQLLLTHHWQAHNAEAWVASVDPFQPNTIYSGADDSLLKVWDLRLIDCVSQTVCCYDEVDASELTLPPLISRGNVNYKLHRQQSLPSTHGLGRSLDMSPWSTHNQHTTKDKPDTKFADNYRLNVPFGLDDMPTLATTAYPVCVNSEHTAGVVEIKPHPYNPFLLLTGSYDNTISLFDKRSMKKAIARQDTSGGVWRIKWHPNPKYAHYFLMVNMYNGLHIGRLDQLFSSSPDPIDQGLQLQQGDLADLFDATGQSTTSTKCSAPPGSSWPRWSSSDTTEGDVPGSHTLFAACRQGKTTPSVSSLDPNESPMAQYVQKWYSYGNDPLQMENANIIFDRDYQQHGGDTVVYGGDWCRLNTISDQLRLKEYPNHRVSNIIASSSFYNKRTDIVSAFNPTEDI